jgi:hypothetical protein
MASNANNDRVRALRQQQRTDRECAELAEALGYHDTAAEFRRLVEKAERLIRRLQ